MHHECRKFLRKFFTLDPLSVIEIGSRDINGSARAFFPNAKWIGLDLYHGTGVDIVVNAVDYSPQETVDLVVCCEVFEHTMHWGEIIKRVISWLSPGGRFIVTCAGPGRPVHSAIAGEKVLHPGEHYENLAQDDLRAAMLLAGFDSVETSEDPIACDTYAIGVKS